MKSFLVVEDNDSLRLIYEKLIRKRFGHIHIDHVGNGRDAFNKIKKLDYNTIIADIDLPVMNGIEFLKNLEKDFPLMAQRTVFISGALMSEENSYILERSRPHLVKPFTAEEFDTFLSHIIFLSDENFTLNHGRKCDRGSVRFRADEECFIIPLAEAQEAWPIKCRAINYSIGGLAIQYEDKWLPATAKVRVCLDKLDMLNKKAKLVWTRKVNGRLQSGLQWASF